MTYQNNNIVLSDSYIPDLAYKNESNSILILANEDDQKKFMLDTALYYTAKGIPVVFVTDDIDELEKSFSAFPESERLRGKKELTYHTGTLGLLCTLIDVVKSKRMIRPIIIFFKSLPETLTDEAKDIFRFAESVKPLFTQVYMFAPELYDYFYDYINHTAELEYYRNANDEQTIMKIQFSNSIALDDDEE